MSGLVLPIKPYPGLRYFESDDVLVFAGRRRDVRDCTVKLMQSNVLILHGRTGCGKSSFLRAGMRPALKRSQLSLRLAEGQELRVVRSGARPLRRIAQEVFAIAQNVAAGGALYGGGDAALARSIIEGRAEDGFITDLANNEARLVEAIAGLAESLSAKPVIVVDQAEEIYTLEETLLRAEQGRNEDGKANDPKRRLKQEQRRYFNFLNKAAQGKLNGVRLVVSLRTEYKGQLDDDIAKRGHLPQDGYTGYYLAELEADGLLEAIRRPTLTRAELADALGLPAHEAAALQSPRDVYQFEYGDGPDGNVAKEIVEKTLNEGVPQGGRLPAVQVACLRLYERLSRMREHAGAHAGADGRVWQIRMNDVRGMGKAGNQVGEYLRESVEVAMRASFDRKYPDAQGMVAISFADAADRWYEGLQQLKRLEPDGRATTRTVTESALTKQIGDALDKLGEPQAGVLKPLVHDMLAALQDLSILRNEKTVVDPLWSLGHDSLALALNSWNLTYGRSLEGIMKSGMNSPRNFAEYKLADLFGDAPPRRHRIAVPADYLWDHQLPHFAQMRGFSERLGITLCEDDRFNALRPGAFDGWNDLRRAIIDREPTGGDDHVLVPYEFQAFPTPEELGKWTDILVTDLFMGSCLMGRRSEAIEDDLVGYEGMEKGQRRLRSIETLGRIIERLFAMDDLKIYVYEKDSAKEFLKLACRLAAVGSDRPLAAIDSDRPLAAIDPDWITARADDILIEVSTRYSDRDVLLDTFQKTPPDSNSFMIGTAFGRALGRQAGLRVYFGAQHLVDLADQQVQLDGKEGRRSPDIVIGVQRTLLHTIWQIGIPPVRWTRSENRALVLRLAAIGYYTVDYLRSFADDYVNYVYDRVNRVMGRGAEMRAGGIQLNRDEIRESVQASFTFLSFDEYPRTVFDLESTRAYYWKLDTGSGKSVAHEIYLELCRLRAATLESFELATRHLIFLRETSRPDAACSCLEDTEWMKDTLLPSALRLMEQAWRNSRIYNFLDAEAQMRTAADRLQIVVDSVR